MLKCCSEGIVDRTARPPKSARGYGGFPFFSSWLFSPPSPPPVEVHEDGSTEQWHIAVDGYCCHASLGDAEVVPELGKEYGLVGHDLSPLAVRALGVEGDGHVLVQVHDGKRLHGGGVGTRLLVRTGQLRKVLLETKKCSRCKEL